MCCCSILFKSLYQKYNMYISRWYYLWQKEKEGSLSGCINGYPLRCVYAIKLVFLRTLTKYGIILECYCNILSFKKLPWNNFRSSEIIWDDRTKSFISVILNLLCDIGGAFCQFNIFLLFLQRNFVYLCNLNFKPVLRALLWHVK